jgi:hypothetical protein
VSPIIGSTVYWRAPAGETRCGTVHAVVYDQTAQRYVLLVESDSGKLEEVPAIMCRTRTEEPS